MTRVLPLFIAAPASTGSHVLAAPPCTQEALTVEGAPVTIGYCITGPLRVNRVGRVIVPVTATYSAPGGTLRRTIELHFIAGEGVSRVIQSLDLDQAGPDGDPALDARLLARPGPTRRRAADARGDYDQVSLPSRRRRATDCGRGGL